MKILISGLVLLLSASWINFSTRFHFQDPEDMVFPRKEAARIMSGEFTGLISDYYLFSSAVLYSSEENRQGKKRLWAIEALKIANYLDPYYQEVYWMAGSLLPWDGFSESALEILKKSTKFLPRNWKNLMSLGILYYMFKKDNEKAAHYFSMASRQKGSPKFLTLLASRLYYKADRIELAIIFLKNQLAGCKEESLCGKIEKRIIGLETIRYLNKKIEAFYALFGYYPDDLEQLFIARLIPFIPPDPYGGKYFITKDKKAWTTSNLR